VLSDDSRVVIKAVPRHSLAGISSKHLGDEPLGEIAAFHLLQKHYYHPYYHHVNTLLDEMADDHYFYLVFDYMPKGDVFSRVAATGGLSEREAASYLLQMVKGLLFMKQCGLAHHDVSLENAIMAEDEEEGKGVVIKIIDLGMCLRVAMADNHHHNHPPTLLYPQKCKGKPNYVVRLIRRRGGL